MLTDQASLRDKIRKAFPPVQFCGQVTDCACEECVSIRHDFGGKAWDEIPTTLVDENISPVLLTPEACRAFLPAFMLRGLDDPMAEERPVADHTLYSLVPEENENPDRTGKRAAIMNVEQRAAVHSYIEYLLDSGHYDLFEEDIRRALSTIWK